MTRTFLIGVYTRESSLSGRMHPTTHVQYLTTAGSASEAIDKAWEHPPKDTSVGWVVAWPLDPDRPVPTMRKVLHRDPEYGGEALV